MRQETLSLRQLTPGGSRRRAFTLVEISIAISIIVLLVGMSVVAFRKVSTNNKNNRTKTSLSTCRSLWDAYGAKDPGYINLASQVRNSYALALTQKFDPASSWVRATAGAQGEHKLQNLVNLSPAGELAAYQLTYEVMRVLAADPDNKKIIAQLPQASLYYLTDAAGNQLNPPLIADGAGEPILFVPAGGLEGAVSKAQTIATKTRLESDGVGHDSTLTNPIDRAAIPRVFWVSGGEDTDFRTSDDNVYSFQN